MIKTIKALLTQEEANIEERRQALRGSYSPSEREEAVSVYNVACIRAEAFRDALRALNELLNTSNEGNDR